MSLYLKAGKLTFYTCLFFIDLLKLTAMPPPAKRERNPTHIAAHLQPPTSQRSNQRFAKELQFNHRTISINWQQLIYDAIF